MTNDELQGFYETNKNKHAQCSVCMG